MRKYLCSAIFTLLLITFFSQCTSNTSDKKDEIKLEFDQNKNIPSSVISQIDYIPLETKYGNSLGKIDKIIIEGNRIYILDARTSRSLYVFEISGKFLFKIQKAGRGPGEYTELNDFTLSDNNIVLLGYQKVLFFDLQGNYLHTENLSWIAENIIFKNNKELYLFQNSFLDKENFVPHHVIKTNAQFDTSDLYLEPLRQELHDYYRFQKFEDMILLSAPPLFVNEIYDISEKDYKIFLKFNFLNKNIPNDIIKEATIKDLKNTPYPIIRNTIITRKMVYFLFSYERILYMGMHFNKSKKTFTGQFIEGVPISLPFIYNIKDDKIYSIVDSYYFITMLNDYVKRNPKADVQNILTLIKNHNITESSNPILICYHINKSLF